MYIMNTIMVPVGKGRANLSALIAKAKAGTSVILTNHGQPEVIISAYQPTGKPWRMPTPGKPERFGDLQSPVMEDWK